MLSHLKSILYIWSWFGQKILLTLFVQETGTKLWFYRFPMARTRGPSIKQLEHPFTLGTPSPCHGVSIKSQLMTFGLVPVSCTKSVKSWLGGDGVSATITPGGLPQTTWHGFGQSSRSRSFSDRDYFWCHLFFGWRNSRCFDMHILTYWLDID